MSKRELIMWSNLGLIDWKKYKIKTHNYKNYKNYNKISLIKLIRLQKYNILVIKNLILRI